jgi:hypothetical protein
VRRVLLMKGRCDSTPNFDIYNRLDALLSPSGDKSLVLTLAASVQHQQQHLKSPVPLIDNDATTTRRRHNDDKDLNSMVAEEDNDEAEDNDDDKRWGTYPIGIPDTPCSSTHS